ncbi:MAG TPA: hypothetical protein VGR95_20220 [Thermoanaerobaculia bacterium]|jgi:hypothetical protein|nr:hypothetical protein [Thermoanaerobaculia bacterium]
MTETQPQPVTFTEDHIPFEGIEETIEDQVELYGGEVIERHERERRFILPLRRGLSTGGGVECTVTWAPEDERESTVTLVCNRDVDAPKTQRILLLLVGVIGALCFTVWPFLPHPLEFGALAWIGGAVAIAVYFLTLRKTSGGIAYDFLQRLARRQRENAAVAPES